MASGVSLTGLEDAMPPVRIKVKVASRLTRLKLWDVLIPVYQWASGADQEGAIVCKG